MTLPYRVFGVALLVAGISRGGPSRSDTAPTAAESTAPPVPRTLTHSESWIGNSLIWPKWVQKDGLALAVAPDGRCYVVGGWDEAGKGGGIYQNGDSVGKLQGIQVGDGAAAADATYVFAGNHRDSPPSDASRVVLPGEAATATEPLFGLSRFHLDGSPAPVAGHGNFLPVSSKWIGGACLNRGELFVGDQASNTIRVFDSETLAEKRKFSCQQPFRMACDGTGQLWVISRVVNAFGGKPATLNQYTPDGRATGKVIADADGATALSSDPQGHLLVAGPHGQVITYDVAGAAPRPIRTLGLKDGVAGGVPGRMAPDKLLGLFGVSTDAAGNIYTLGRAPAVGGGVDLREFTATGKPGWNLVWTQFTDMGWVDPRSDGADLYTRDEHFVIDYSKPAGRQWKWQGYTLDPRYDDGRLEEAGTGNMFDWSSPIMRWLDGRLYMFQRPGSTLGIFRQGPGEAFIPAGAVDMAPDWMKKANDDRQKWPSQQPPNARWIWRDKNGDGRVQPDEFESRPVSDDVQVVSDMWVDTRGDIWMAGVGAGEPVHFGRALWHVPLKGFDGHHNPIYQLASVTPFPVPDEFGTNPVTRIIYDADHDVMYLSGMTTAHPKSLNPVGAGSEIIRYDRWSTAQRKVRWRIVLPEDRTARSKEDQASGVKDSSWFEAFTVAGDRLFAVQRARSDIFAFGLDTGGLIGKFGPREGEIAGAADMGDGLHAFQRKSGEYVVFAENDYTAAIMLYRLPRF